MKFGEERLPFKFPYDSVGKNEEVDSIYLVCEGLTTGITLKILKHDGTGYHAEGIEILLSVDDPDFDTSQIACLTPDGAVTVMPDTRRAKQ